METRPSSASLCYSPHGGHLTTLPFFTQGPLYALSELENRTLLNARGWKEHGCQSHTLDTSWQTKHAHLHAVHLSTHGHCHSCGVTLQFPPHNSCLPLLTAFSAPSCKILPGLVNLERSEEKLYYLKKTQQTPLGLLNLPCIQWPHRCCPGSGGQWLPVSCLAQTIHLQNRQLVPKGDSCLTCVARVWDSPILTPSTASTNRIRNSSLGSTWDGKVKILKETQKASQTSTMFVSTKLLPCLWSVREPSPTAVPQQSKPPCFVHLSPYHHGPVLCWNSSLPCNLLPSPTQSSFACPSVESLNLTLSFNAFSFLV